MDEWKVRGPARTVRREHAEWDFDRGAWGPPRSAASMTYREDGQVSHGESRNPDGSISRWAATYKVLINTAMREVVHEFRRRQEGPDNAEVIGRTYEMNRSRCAA